MLDFEKILKFLSDDLAIEVADIDRDTPLFSTGVIDSFALVSIMSFVERGGGIVIAPVDISLANFDTIGRMLDYLDRASARADDAVLAV